MHLPLIQAEVVPHFVPNRVRDDTPQFFLGSCHFLVRALKDPNALRALILFEQPQ